MRRGAKKPKRLDITGKSRSFLTLRDLDYYRKYILIYIKSSYLRVMVEARRIELLSESASGRFSTGVVYCFDSTSDGAIDKPVRVITGIVPRSAPGGHGSFF